MMAEVTGPAVSGTAEEEMGRHGTTRPEISD